MSNVKRASFVDYTVRLKWKLTKEEFDSCAVGDYINSENYKVQIGTEISEWNIFMYPKGDDKEDDVEIYVELMKGDEEYDALVAFGVKTDLGQWPNGDLVEKLHSNKLVSDEKIFKVRSFNLDGTHCCGFKSFSTTEELRNKFVQNKITLVATLVFRTEGKQYFQQKYLQQKEVSDAYVEDLRSMTLQDNLSDVTIICSGKQFPSYKLLLATRSKYFEALFTHEPQKMEVHIEEASPEIVEAMLDFMSKGLIPSDIDAKAVDLIEVADKYRIELLSKVCLTSMVDNLTADNALETLVTVDKLKHISKSEHYDKIISFIKKEKNVIVKGENWERFILSYPSLVTEIFLSF